MEKSAAGSARWMSGAAAEAGRSARSVDWTDVGEGCAELIARAAARVLARARAEIRQAEELLVSTQAWPRRAPESAPQSSGLVEASPGGRR